MKKSHFFIFVFLLLLSVGTVSGQGYTFRVLANKGTNQIKKAGTSQGLPLKTGATLNIGDELIVGADAYIGLMHSSGKTLEVRATGSQKVADLEKQVAAKNTSVASKYAQFIASKMNEDGSTSVSSRMNATGAVSRAVGDADIIVLLPDMSVDVLGNSAIIEWEPAKDVTDYTVTVQNIFEDVIFTDETSATSIDLNFDEMETENGLYLVTVSKKGDAGFSSKKFGLKKVSSDDRADLISNYEGLKSEVSEDSPLSKLIYASFFEENGLFLDAFTKYQEAMRMSPEVPDFKILYDAFMLNYGMMKAEE
ncbi:MAG: hypothetical protein OEY56_00950 [Cyclobacteriaceae bacterium]|nr:hypothetical protein [Cyclobacteriaceae bacterium]